MSSLSLVTLLNATAHITTQKKLNSYSRKLYIINRQGGHHAIATFNKICPKFSLGPLCMNIKSSEVKTHY